jgi:hypothetical protein
MKVWIFASLFSVAAIPVAGATENTAECQLDDARRAESQRVEAPSTAATTTARPTVAQREAVTEPVARPPGERRRGGKRIPDAELIGPRGAL